MSSSALSRRWARWAVAVVIVAVILGLLWRHKRVREAATPPIVASTTAEWTADRTAIALTTHELRYLDSCKAVRISRWLILEDTYDLVPTTVLGPEGDHVLAPRRVISIEPREIGEVSQVIEIPPWIREQRQRVLGVVAEAAVAETVVEAGPDGQKLELPNCASGYFGTFKLYDVSFTPGNDLPAPLPPEP